MNTFTKILLALFLVSLGVLWWKFEHPTIEKEYVPTAGKIPPPKVIYTTSKTGTQVATIKTPAPVLEPAKVASEELLNTVKNIEEIDKDAKITELTKISTELKLQLDAKSMALNDAEKQIKVWKDNYNSVTVDNLNNTVAVHSEVSPVIVGYEKRPKWYKAKESYTSITSNNPAIMFNGVETLKVPNKQVKNFLELTFDADTGQYFYDREFIKGLMFYDASLNVIFNPDGRIRPYINVGTRTYNFKTQSPYWSGGLKILITKF